MNFNAIKFDFPFALGAFAIFIPLVIYDIYSRFRKNKPNLPEDLAKKLRSSVFLFRLFIIFSIIAIAGPRWGIGFAASEFRRGLDAVFAIDVSRSMDIRDAQTGGGNQSRLERGLLIAKESVASVSGARFAAAIGRGQGYLAVPLTWDNEAALSFLESLDGFSVTGRSTNLESLVDAAADAFQSSSPARKVIVLVSDGESHAGILRNALNRCVKDGITVYAVALGSDTGRPIAAETDNPQSGAVISRRDSSVMRSAAERTGGVYIDGSRDDSASVLSGHLLSIAHETGPGNSRPEPKERRTLFIILAIISYGISKFIPLIPQKRTRLHTMRSHMPSQFVSIIAVLFIFSSCSEGKLLLMEANYLHSRGKYDEALVPYQKALQFEDAAPYAEYGIGLTFYSLDEGRAALKRYGYSQKMLETLSAAEHRELRFRNSYNSGIIFFEEGDFNSAADAFKDALRSDPRRIEAKRNLELSLMSIARKDEEDSRNENRRESETKEILFDFLRQNEQQQWKSREWAPEEKFTGPDY
jgi:Ca-activated chloride channel family protein